MKKPVGIRYNRLVLGLFSIGLMTTAIGLFAITYLGGLSVADHEVARRVQKEHGLARLAFESYLKQLEIQLRSAAVDQKLIDAINARDRERATRVLKQLGQNTTGPLPDILVLEDEQQNDWLNLSFALMDVTAILSAPALQVLPPDVWRFYSDEGASPAKTVVVTAIPIVDPSDGKVIARLVGGSSINDNFTLLDSLATLLDVESLAIVHDGKRLASLGGLSDAGRFAEVETLLAGKAFHLESQRLYMKSTLYSDEQNHPIYLLADETSDIITDLRSTYFELFIPFLMYVGIAALAAAAILNRITAPALSALVSHATARRNQGMSGTFQPGRISEYNRLGALFDEAFEAVHSTNAQFRELVDGSLQGVYVQRGTTILYANRALMKMLRHPPDDPDGLIGGSTRSLYVPSEVGRMQAYDALRLRGEVVPDVYEVQCMRRDGETVWVEQHVRITTWDNEPAIYVTLSDISDRKEQERLIEQQSNYDHLTSLPNRTLFLDRLRQAIAQSGRSGDMCALIILDIERFKTINDTFGHGFGDEIIKTLGSRMNELAEWNETVARLGGDEFAFILPDVEDEWKLEQRARKILDTVSRKCDLDAQKDFFLTASVGITVCPYDGTDEFALMRQADAAMYQAKSDGGNRFRFFSRQMKERNTRTLQLESALRTAIEEERIEICMQPIIDCVSGSIAGCEALARWTDPEMGPVSPGEFIPVAEESGLIIPLGMQVLRKACEFQARCIDHGLNVEGIGVNISPRQCREEGFVNSVSDILEQTGVNPRNLRLEITENVMFDDKRIDPVALLKALKSLGISIALDDFGTGYSSLSYLKRLPIDILKVDRTFVSDLENDTDDQVLVEAILSMAGKLGVDVICEGAETRRQCDILVDLGCRKIQGFYFGKPMPEQEFFEFALNRPYANDFARRTG